MHDIYDPPPAPVPLEPPQPEPLSWTAPDLTMLALLALGVVALAAWAWSYEPTMAILTLGGGAMVILESWFSALTFLHRHPAAGETGRIRVFLAALVPWAIGLGLAAALMLLLFSLSDSAG
ncbi:MAG: hypothetical protein SFX72_06935 [Isosphaeraceae bacterium]|nr:hypothetical protein [Isosphaeraceae bacterium]